MYKPHTYTCELPGFHCYGVAWSPFQRELLAVVSGTNYGLSGAGRVDVLTAAPQQAGRLTPCWSAPWPDVVTDVTWSEASPTTLVAGTGDRAVVAFDTAKPGAPSIVRREHGQEVSSVAWSLVRSHQAVLSASWDGTAKQWDAAAGLVCTQTFPVCVGRVYDAAWSPTEAGRFVTAAADGVLRVWSAAAGRQPVLSLPGPPAELLSCDWSRYSAHLLAAAGTDGCLRLWDVRSGRAPLHQLTGHVYAIKKARFASFDSDLLATVSYDKTCRLWSISRASCVSVLTSHREFVYGLDWSVLDRHTLATCGWDSSVRVHQLPS